MQKWATSIFSSALIIAEKLDFFFLHCHFPAADYGQVVNIQMLFDHNLNCKFWQILGESRSVLVHDGVCEIQEG